MTKKTFFGLALIGLDIVSSFSCAVWADEYNPSYTRGLSQFEHRNYNDAINSFDEVIGLNANSDKAYFKRGQCFYNLQNYQSAMVDFEQAVKLNPDSSDYYLYRGTTHAKLGEHEQAVKDYVKAIKLNPQLFKAYYSQGDVSQFKDKHQLRARKYNQGLVNQLSGEINLKASQAYNNSGDNDGAVADYNKAMGLATHNGSNSASKRRSKDDDASTNNLNNPMKGKIANNPERAAEDYSEAIEQDPQNDFYYFKRAKAYEQLGRKDEALKDYGQAITINPLAKYFLARARLYHDMNKEVLSQADIRRAQSVDAKLPRKLRLKGDN